MMSKIRNTTQHSIGSLRRVAWLVQLAVLAVAVITTVPVHAADSRPIKVRVAPHYPELAKRMRVSGVVRISASVAPDGSVSATKTLSGNHILATAAEDAVHLWKFVPAPDASTVEVDVSFALAQ
jgi:TonB family protein